MSPRLWLPARLFLERILFSLRDAVLVTRLFGQLCADRIEFPLSAGVANVRRYLDVLDPPPVFIADGEGGEGFAEIARVVLDARR